MFDSFPSVRLLVVSYEDEEALRKLLEENKIEVVLSTISTPGVSETQVRLIKACSASSSVKRFAPSDWLLDFGKTDEYVPVKYTAL